MIYYLFDDFGRFAGTSDVQAERSTTAAPPELTSDYNWNDYEWVYAPNVSVHSMTLIQHSPAIESKTITPVAFKLRFTAQERVAIYNSTDLFVIDFRNLLDDSRLKEVDLTLQPTVDAMGYLASLSLITQARASEILA
jgi:hypothetical protein